MIKYLNSTWFLEKNYITSLQLELDLEDNIFSTECLENVVE